MIHIFFSVHLTIYRSAKSQPSSLRFELIICSISDFSGAGKSPSLFSSPPNLTVLSEKKHPDTRLSHCSFWPDIQGKLKKYSNKKVHIFFLKWIQQKIIFTLKHGSIFQYNIFSNMIFTCYKENFKSVKTLVVFFLCLLGDLIDLVPCITKSLSSTELTDNVTSNEKKKKDIQLYE